MLLLSGIATSMDSFFLGIFLKANQTKLPFKISILLWSGLFLLLLFFHFLFQFFHITLTYHYIKSILFFLLAIVSLKKEKKTYSKKLSMKELLFIIISNSIDSFWISLTFIHQYSILFLCLLFSFISIFFLNLGFLCSIPIKKENYISAIFFFLLAIEAMI